MPQANASESTALSVLAHCAALFTSFIVSVLGPIFILGIADSATVRNNARESLNFQLTMFIYALISLPLCLIFIGFITLGIVAIWSIIAPIIAMLNVANNPGAVHRYGFIIHFLKQEA